MPEDFKQKLKELKDLAFQLEMMNPNGRTVHAKANLMSMVTIFSYLEKDLNFVPTEYHYEALDRSVTNIRKFIKENRT